MKHFFAAFFLILVSGGTYADWIKVQDNKDLTGFADPASLKRSGSFIRLWEMRTFKSPRKTQDGAKYLSMKNLVEYDCEGDRLRYFSISFYPKADGQGDVIDLTNIPNGSDWFPNAPGSDGKAYQDGFCSMPR